MTLTYNDIAKWIEPVAEKHENSVGVPVMTLGAVAMCNPTFNPQGWRMCLDTVGEHCDAIQVADLACMELVRRLNEKGYEVLFRKGGCECFNGETGWGDGKPYTTHPLEAVAGFCKEVGA